MNALPMGEERPLTVERGNGAGGGRTRDNSGVKDVLRFFGRRRKLIAIVSLLLTSLGLIAFALQTPKYSSTAILLVTPNGAAAKTDGDTQEQRRQRKGFIDTQVELIRSQAAIRQVAKELNLYSDPEWNGAPRAGNPAITDIHSFIGALQSMGRASNPSQSRSPFEIQQQVEQAVGKALSVRRKKQSYVVEVTFSAERAGQAAQIANALVDRYTERQYLSEMPSIAQDIADSNEQLAKLEAEMHRAANAAAALKASNKRLQDALRSATPVVSPSADNSQPSGFAVDPRQQALQEQLATQLSAQSEQLLSLQNEAAIARLSYEQALNAPLPVKPPPADAAPHGITATVVQVSGASAPARPSSPRILPWLAISFGLSLITGLVLALIVDVADARLGNSEEAARKTGETVLTSVPLLNARDLRQLPPQDRHPAGFLVEKAMSHFAERVRTLRAAILYTVRDRPAKVICITSAAPREGKTTIALSFARASALAGQKVLLVDGDAHQNSAAEILGLSPPEAGAVEHDAWRGALTQDPETTLEILPVAVLLQLRQVLLDELREQYSLVIIDAPAVLKKGNARALAHASDQTILVARWSKTSARAVKRAIAVLRKDGAYVPGLLLNAVDASARGRLSYEDAGYQERYSEGYVA